MIQSASCSILIDLHVVHCQHHRRAPGPDRCVITADVQRVIHRICHGIRIDRREISVSVCANDHIGADIRLLSHIFIGILIQGRRKERGHRYCSAGFIAQQGLHTRFIDHIRISVHAKEEEIFRLRHSVSRHMKCPMKEIQVCKVRILKRLFESSALVNTVLLGILIIIDQGV